MRLKRYRNTWNKNFRPYIPKKHSIAKIYGEATGKETVILIVDDRFSYMIKNGIYLAPSQFEAMFLSAAMTEEELANTLEIFKGYLKQC